MTNHDSYWVTVGAAAPVIALTHAALLAPSLRLTLTWDKRPAEAWLSRTWRWLLTFGPWIAAIAGATCCTWALIASLVTLERGKDFSSAWRDWSVLLSPWYITTLVATAAILLFVQGFLTAVHSGRGTRADSSDNPD